MDFIELVNPIFVPIIGIALAVAYVAGKSSTSTRRILAVLMGSFAGFGAAVAVNALLLSIISWHSVLSGASVYTGDIMTGLMMAGAGLGLVASLFIAPQEQAPSQPDMALKVADRDDQLVP